MTTERGSLSDKMNNDWFFALNIPKPQESKPIDRYDTYLTSPATQSNPTGNGRNLFHNSSSRDRQYFDTVQKFIRQRTLRRTTSKNNKPK
jgi:hypothetical protein